MDKYSRIILETITVDSFIEFSRIKFLKPRKFINMS